MSTASPATHDTHHPSSSAAAFVSRVAATTQSAIAAARPWRELLDPFSFSLPPSLSDATARIKRNTLRFNTNYTIAVLVILFLSLLYHPISMVVFLAVFAAWLFLYFSRDDPLIIFDRFVDDRVILVALGVSTLLALVLTRVWLNVLVSLTIGAVVVTLHAAFRVTDDFAGDDQESPYGAMLSVTDSPRGDYTEL